MKFVANQQTDAAIPVAQRVQIQVLKSSSLPVVIKPRGKTLPIMVFFAVLTAPSVSRSFSRIATRACELLRLRPTTTSRPLTLAT